MTTVFIPYDKKTKQVSLGYNNSIYSVLSGANLANIYEKLGIGYVTPIFVGYAKIITPHTPKIDIWTANLKLSDNNVVNRYFEDLYDDKNIYDNFSYRIIVNEQILYRVLNVM
jgi:hypothetical protein